ncbi:CppA N-terminal domain-containing protein [Streptococcus dentasini]
MTIFDGISLSAPVLRVNNRERNIEFYCKTLGFKVLKEENTEVFFGGHAKKIDRFRIEESPSMRVRAVEGPKKLHRLYIKATVAGEIEALLAKGASYQHLYKGDNGYAFEALSPEGDTILLHAEDDVSSLKDISNQKWSFQTIENFQGLSDYQVDKLILNVPDLQQSNDFYQYFAGLSFLPDLRLTQGSDLQAEPNSTWDLEFLEYHVPDDYDLSMLKSHLETLGLDVYLDRAQTVLVLSDPSRVEIWFSK